MRTSARHAKDKQEKTENAKRDDLTSPTKQEEGKGEEEAVHIFTIITVKWERIEEVEPKTALRRWIEEDVKS